MSRRHFAAAAVLSALLSMAGCVSPPAAPPATVTVIGVPESAKLSVIVQNHPDAMASQVRSIFFAAAMQTLERQLADALKPRAFAPAAALTEEVAAALQRPGRAVARVGNPQKGREDFLKDYAALGVNAGLLIDVVPREIGYWAESPTGAFRPWVVVAYRIHDVRAGKILATGLIGMGPAPSGETSNAVAQDDQFSFPSFEALRGDPARAEAGLAAAIRQVARALAQNI